MRASVAPSMRARRVVGVVVRQVGADHDQRLRPAPQPLEHLPRPPRTLASPTASGTSAKSPSMLLQERQLHFERMLERVRAVARHHLRQVAQLRAAPRGRCARGRAAWRTPRALGTARPRTATRCAGPSSTTRLHARRAPPRARRRRAPRPRRSRCSRRAARSAPWGSPGAARALSTPPSSSSTSAARACGVAGVEHARDGGGSHRVHAAIMRLRAAPAPLRGRGSPTGGARFAAAAEPARLAAHPTALAAPRRSTPCRPACAALPPAGPGDAGDGERDRRRGCAPARRAAISRAVSSLTAPWRRRVLCLDAEQLALGGVRVGDEAALEPGRGAGDRRDRLRHPAAGAGLGGDQHRASRRFSRRPVLAARAFTGRCRLNSGSTSSVYAGGDQVVEHDAEAAAVAPLEVADRRRLRRCRRSGTAKNAAACQASSRGTRASISRKATTSSQHHRAMVGDAEVPAGDVAGPDADARNSTAASASMSRRRQHAASADPSGSRPACRRCPARTATARRRSRAR